MGGWGGRRRHHQPPWVCCNFPRGWKGPLPGGDIPRPPCESLSLSFLLFFFVLFVLFPPPIECANRSKWNSHFFQLSTRLIETNLEREIIFECQRFRKSHTFQVIVCFEGSKFWFGLIFWQLFFLQFCREDFPFFRGEAARGVTSYHLASMLTAGFGESSRSLAVPEAASQKSMLPEVASLRKGPAMT